MGSSSSKRKLSSSAATRRSNGYSSSSDYSSAQHLSAHLANLALQSPVMGDEGGGGVGGGGGAMGNNVEGVNNQQYLYHQRAWRRSRGSQAPHYGSNNHLQQHTPHYHHHQHHSNHATHRRQTAQRHHPPPPARDQRREFEVRRQYYADPLLLTASYDGESCVSGAGAKGGAANAASAAATSTNATTFNVAKAKARRFKGASSHKVLARFSKSQPDCCSECIEPDCSCSSAISSENDNIGIEENIDIPVTRRRGRREYYIPAQEDSGNHSQVFDDQVVTEEEIFNRVGQYRLAACLDKQDPQISNSLASSEQKGKTPLSSVNMTTTANKNHSINNNNNNNDNGKMVNNKASNGDTPCYKMSSVERGLAADKEDRETHGLLGLLPAAVQDQDLQSRAVINYLTNCKDELSKYVYLRHLKDFNEKLFYYTLTKNVEKCMPIVYTPTVGLACQKFSEIYMRPRGLFITANDKGRISQILANWPEKDVRVIVVTDGERILGLGDLGANGMGISIGKLSLYTALAGIPPQNVLPITIDIGTNNEFNLKDPFYIGLRQPRIRGEQYDQLIDEFMQAVVERYGRSCLIQFEDFGNSTAFNLLKRYRDDYCTFNDDIQGTASVCLSGLISATKMIGKRLRDCSFLFYGAGEANLGTAQLLVMAMMEDGLGKTESRRHIWLVDSKGLVTSSRTDLSSHKREFAQDAPQLKDLEEIIGHTHPTAIIGASAQGGSFTESICRKMAQQNERPIIFALSNPTSKAECTADQAYKWTDGKCVFASGSPFEPVVYNGQTYITGQGNNAYIFPAVGLAAIGAHTHIIPEEALLVAARALSDLVTSSDTEVGLVYPRLSRIREVTLRIATRVLEYFYAERLATYRPEPSDKLEFLKGIQYDPSY